MRGSLLYDSVGRFKSRISIYWKGKIERIRLFVPRLRCPIKGLTTGQECGIIHTLTLVFYVDGRISVGKDEFHRNQKITLTDIVIQSMLVNIIFYRRYNKEVPEWAV